MRTVGLVSLGCAKNRVDAEHLLGGLAARGFTIVEDPAQAEIVIVNTCGFIREAVEESIEEILEAARLKETGNCRELVVAGCLVKRYPELPEELPEVDRFFTPEDIPRIPALLAGADPAEPLGGPLPRMLTQLPHSTYLKIAEGCSNRCTYCTIPSIRGPFRSLPEEELLDEARRLVAAGVRELNLVAQDVTSYGLDRDDPGALARLLDRLSDLEGLRWIRLLYAYPRPFPPGVVERLGAGGKVVPYLDMPIQHIHPRILRAMGRRATADEVRAVIDDLRARVPGLVLRTTAIVGFPGETDEEFDSLVRFVEDVGFHHLGAFAYSPEEGTPAERFRPRVKRAVVEARLERLLEVQAGVSRARNREFLGRELEVLVEGFDEEGRVVGRTYGQAPEVDGFTVLEGYPDEVVEIGGFVRARITSAGDYDLAARVVEA
ncbi:30S ribosomal protein S12 methylthiotransferase RimO [Deferrisoma palaeochoriense]